MNEAAAGFRSDRHPVERLLQPVDTPVLVDYGLENSSPPSGAHDVRSLVGAGAHRWLRNGDWRVFARVAAVERETGREELERFTLDDGPSVSVTRDPASGTVTIPFSLADAFDSYVSERWRGEARGRALSPRQLAVFYRLKRLIPRSAQLVARRILVRYQGRPEFPRWPLDDSMGRLVELYARCLCMAAGASELPFRWFWPEPYRSALILTHDVESAEGLRLAVDIADLEESGGLRSSFNVVADWYPIDEGILRELAARGFEVGVHGIYHDRSMFASRASFGSPAPAGGAGRSAVRRRRIPFTGDAPGVRVAGRATRRLRRHDAALGPVRADPGRLLLIVAVLHRVRGRAPIHDAAGPHALHVAAASHFRALDASDARDPRVIRADAVRHSSGSGLPGRPAQARTLRRAARDHRDDDRRLDRASARGVQLVARTRRLRGFQAAG